MSGWMTGMPSVARSAITWAGALRCCAWALAPHASELSDAATRQNIPLKVLDVSDTAALDLYDCNLALIRRDQYVAWRGNSTPADPDDLLSQVTGSDL